MLAVRNCFMCNCDCSADFLDQSITPFPHCRQWARTTKGKCQSCRSFGRAFRLLQRVGYMQAALRILTRIACCNRRRSFTKCVSANWW